MDKTGVKLLTFCVEVINSIRQLREKIDHVVQIHVCRLT